MNTKNKKNPHIAALIMMKDEESRLHVTLKSIIGYVKSIVAYDTGSTDNTLKILKEFCDQNKIPLRLKIGEFIQFSVSRNISLDFADTFEDIDFILLLDVNDELQGGDKLLEFCKNEMDTPNNAFLICQHWWSGKYDKYFNNRLLKARKEWRYHGSVHEWLSDDSPVKGPFVKKIPDDIILYQDRTMDNNKSGARFARDKVLLLADHKTDTKEPRSIFYLAQTCSCLDQKEDSFYYYKLRTELEGFQEEKFHAFLRAGEMSEQLNHDWYTSFEFFMKAFEHSARVEPLIRIAVHYKDIKQWILSYTFIKLACSLPYPTEAILFVDKYSYDYTRWHIMGIVAYYYEDYEYGKTACLKAIEFGLNKDLDKHNLEFYEKKEQEISNSQLPLSKQQFIQKTISQLQKQNPNLETNKLHKIAVRLWKNRHNDKK
jgi:glycosyltransferase involved in cell wall biosynthesis